MFMLVPLRRAVSASVALILASAATSVLAQTQTFNLQSQPAVNAIPMFARQAGIQIVAPAGKLDGINTQAIHGDMDRRQALARLLEGTPLVVSSDDGKVVILQLAETPKPAAGAPVKGKPQAANTAVEERCQWHLRGWQLGRHHQRRIRQPAAGQFVEILRQRHSVL